MSTPLPRGDCLSRMSDLDWPTYCRVTVSLAVYCHSLYLDFKPPVAHTKSTRAPRTFMITVCTILSSERMGLSLMNMLGMHITHLACYWLLQNIEVLCQSRHCRAGHAYLICCDKVRSLVYGFGMDITENIACSSSVVFRYFTVEACLLSHSLAPCYLWLWNSGFEETYHNIYVTPLLTSLESLRYKEQKPVQNWEYSSKGMTEGWILDWYCSSYTWYSH